MKIAMAALCLCLLLASASSFSPAASRENPLFDAYSSITFEAEKARLGNFAIQLKNTVNSRGLILVHAQSPAGAKDAQARARRAKWYLVRKLGIDAQRVSWKYAGTCQQMVVSLYLLYPNEADPVANC